MTNTWAVILGGSTGLGLASAKKLAQNGYHIIIIHRSPRMFEKHNLLHFEDIKSFGVQLKTYNIDATKPNKRNEVIDDLKSVFNPSEKISVLVHSIAKGNLKPMHSDTHPELQQDDFNITFQAMALSLYDWVKDLFKAQLFSNDTRVISFTSEGNQKVIPNYAAVSVAKVSLEALTKHIAVEFASFGIKANCIQAGVTETESLKRIPGYEKLITYSLKRNPNHRLTKPEDVANAVYLLCLPEANWITGNIIPVDGGEHLI